MKRRRTTSGEDGARVPAYIVTFSDMVTLLLTFFVLLLSMAEDQNTELFRAGQSAFKRALADFGLSGYLFSSHSGPEFDHPKAKYRVDEGQDEPEERSIDSETEMLRRIILDLERMVTISPSQITSTSNVFTVTDIQFEAGGWSLNESAKQFLTKYIGQLQENFAAQPLILYVVGLAENESSQEQQWLVSARRAEEVAGFIKSNLTEGSVWPVYSWGAGPGGEWSGPTGLISKQTSIMIAALIERK